MSVPYDKKYAQYQYRKGLGTWHRDLLLVLDKHLISLKNKTVLDIGCGEGTLMLELAKRGAQVEGIDLSDEAVQLCQKRDLKAQKLDFLATELPWSDYFDMATASEVIEHLFDPYLFLARSNQVLKNKGLLLITTPNFSYYRWLIGYLKGKTPTQLQNPTHIRFFTKQFLQLLLEKQGFQVIEILCLYHKRWLQLFGKIGLSSLVEHIANRYGARLVALASKTGLPQYRNIEEHYMEYHANFRTKLRYDGSDEMV